MEQNRPAIRAPHASGDVMLEHQQVVQIVGRHKGGRSHVHQPSLDVLDAGWAQLVGVGDYIVPVESAGDDDTAAARWLTRW
jgi:hypothetical protein